MGGGSWSATRTAREEHEQTTSRDMTRDGQSGARSGGEMRTISPQQTSTKCVVDDNNNGKSGPTAGERAGVKERTCGC